VATFNSISAYGNINCVPRVDAAETGIGFFKHTSKGVSATGDVWSIGRNLNNTSDHFVIACNNINNCLTIGLDGTVDIPYKLTVQGNSLATTVASQINVAELNSINTFTASINYFQNDLSIYGNLYIDGIDFNTQIGYRKLSEDIDKLIYYDGATHKNYITAVNQTNNISQLAIKANNTNILEIDGSSASFYIPILASSLTVNGTHINNGSIVAHCNSSWGSIRCVAIS
jgi:hypothetical protein